MEIIFAPNFDYELALAGVESSKLRAQIVARFEWLILWGEDEHSFYSTTQFDEAYRDYVGSFKSLPQQETKREATHNWWGALEHLECERKLNSKLFAAQMASQHLGFPFALKGEREQLEATQVLYKDEFSVAGRGFSSSPRESTSFCEPIYQRSADVGSRYDKTHTGWCLRHRSLSLIDHKFSFRGALLDFEGKFPLDFTDHDRQQLLILNSLPTDFQITSIQMDSFFYQDGRGNILAKGLGEFNYRRTMIDVFYHLLRILNLKRAQVLMRAISPLQKQQWLQLTALCGDRAIVLNPPHARDLVLLIKDEAQAQDLLSEIAHKLLIQF